MREYKTQMDAVKKRNRNRRIKESCTEGTLACGRVDASGGSRKGCHLRK